MKLKKTIKLSNIHRLLLHFHSYIQVYITVCYPASNQFKMKNQQKLLILGFIAFILSSVSALDIGALITDAFAEDKGSYWKGFDIELLRNVYSGTFDDSDFTAYTSMNDLLSDVKNGVMDIGLGAITKTAERETDVNFSHNTFDSGLRIMTHNDVDTSAVVSKFLSSFFNAQFLFTIFIIILVVFLISVIVWTLEVFFTETKMKFFNDDWKIGIVEALGWSTKNLMKKETYTPNHTISKSLGFVLMIFSVVFLASLTAYIATQMIILSDNSPTINNLDGLIGKRVGTVDGSTSHDFLLKDAGGSIIRTYPSLDKLFETFHDERRLDAVVYDFPILLYHVNQREKQGNFDTVVVGPIYDRQSYGYIIDPVMTTLEENINKGVLEFAYTDNYFELYERYFGTNNIQEQTVGLDVGWITWTIISVLIIGAIVVVCYVAHKIRNIPPEEDPHKEINEELGKIDSRKISREDIFRMLCRVLRLNLLTLNQGHLDALRERRYAAESIAGDDFEKILSGFINDTVKHIKENQRTNDV